MKNAVFSGFAKRSTLPVLVSIGLIGCLAALTFAQNRTADIKISSTAQIDVDNWGSITSPVFGTHEAGVYSGAELFAGPNKFGSYYAGVLPNGRVAKPAGTSIQVGMNPLGAVRNPHWKLLLISNVVKQ